MTKKTFKNSIQNPAEMFITIPQQTDEAPAVTTSTTKEATATTEPPNIFKPKEAKSKRLQLLVKPSTFNGIKALADENNTSVNDIINTLLEDMLQKYKG